MCGRCYGSAVAGPGDLDTSFSGDGKRTIDFGGTDAAHALLVRPDGRILVAGGGGPSASFCIARLRRNGALDSSFGSKGKRLVEFGGADESANALARQADGKILLAGHSGTRVAVARLDADGSLDETFAGDGRKILDWGSICRAHSVLVLPNGRILVAGFVGPEGGNVRLSRLRANGSLDPAFGAGGSAELDFGGDDFGLAAARQADGSIVVAGRSTAGGAVVGRLTPNGMPDSAFGSQGRVTLGAGGVARAVLVQPDQRIVVAGNASGNDAMTVTRLRQDGSTDATFGTNGTATIDVGSLADLAYGVALQPDGRLVVAGYSQADEVVAVARLDPGGGLDPTFGAAGKATVDFGAATFGHAVALQRNGRILVAGHKTGTDDFAVARLHG
jgi:uncharacterized delta-60 repeat protein